MFEKIKSIFLRSIKLKYTLFLLPIIFIINIANYFFYFFNFSLTNEILTLVSISFILTIILDFLRVRGMNSLKKVSINFLYIIAFIAMFIISSKAGYYFSDYLRKEQIAKFNNIAISIKKFKIEKGNYPSNLNDLIPDYVKEIPENNNLRFTDIKYKKWEWAASLNNKEETYYICFDDKITGENFCFNTCELWGSVVRTEKYFNDWDRCYSDIF